MNKGNHHLEFALKSVGILALCIMVISWIIVLSFFAGWMVPSDRFYPYNNVVGRYYDDDGKIVIVAAGRSGWALQETATHEICHHIWFTQLSNVQREEYKEIVKSGEEPMSDYARKNIKEDFAEHCTLWVYGDSLPENRSGFMNKNLDGLLDRFIWWGEDI